MDWSEYHANYILQISSPTSRLTYALLFFAAL